MSKFLNIILLASVLSFSSGCALFRNPLASWQKAETKVEEKQKKIEANKDAVIEQGKNYVYATKLALQADPSTNQYHAVETKLNDRAVATLGTPDIVEIVRLETLVKNLLSTNTAIIIKGEQQLAEQDSRVKNLQSERNELLGQLETAQTKLTKIGTENAGLAQKWANLVKVFWWIVYGFIFVIVIKILSAILPPPYNSIVSIISVPIGLIIKGIHGCIPEAKKVAGVVASQTYDTTKLALQHIVEAIEEAKVQKPDVAKELVPFLKDATSKEITRPLITEIKKEMGYV